MYGTIAAIGIGAGLMYLFDDQNGIKRRKQMSDLACEATRFTMETAEKARETAEKTAEEARTSFASLQDIVSSWGSSMGILPKKKRSFFSMSSTPARVLAGSAGTALAYFGLRRWNKAGVSLGIFGLTLLASGIAGRDLITMK